ncbi:putative chitinase [Archangium gephyra]|uniref:Chitinase n=1 Tax=Archangium gephyra TaxID=48 RepID=A0AAC8Q946_9BACT|nr:Membrane-bound lytic murein transglycosylase D precursor [Archangium gephyra]REG22844.1 putative chitinase [Archangium gephyra]
MELSPERGSLSLPREELRLGAQGAAVKLLQRALVELGFLPSQPGSVDGDFGPKTKAALEAFQATEKLPRDGAYTQKAREAFERRRSGGGGGLSMAQLCTIMPRLKPDKAAQYLPFLNAAMNEAEINTSLRRAAFLAQLAHESAQLRFFEELASGEAYEGRRDLGNTQKGDGVRYKGRGPIQLTGRNNYRKAGLALGLDLEGFPQRAADPDVGFRVAGWFWKSNGLNPLADAGCFDAITRRINGGYNGKADRDAHYRGALQVLGDGQPLKSV